MELRSGSLSGTNIEGIEEAMTASNIDREMVEDIWMTIEKRVSMFFIEEQKLRRELLDELIMMREENAKLRGDMNDLKLYLSSEVNPNLKACIAYKESVVANGNAVANENISRVTAKDKIDNQLAEVRNVLKNRFYDQRSSEQADPLQKDAQQLSVKSVDPTIPEIQMPETKTSPSIEAPATTNATQDNINNTKSQWPAGTTLIVGDSMLGGIEEARIGPKRKVRSFPGASIMDMHQYIVPLLRKRPSRIIAHIGTNDAAFSNAKKIAGDLLKLQEFIISQLPECQVIISSPVNRLDDPNKAVVIRNVNVVLKNMSEIELIDNSNITVKHLGKRKLHLNLSGSSMLARNILEKLRSL